MADEHCLLNPPLRAKTKLLGCIFLSKILSEEEFVGAQKE
jgi:hypothetical protein